MTTFFGLTGGIGSGKSTVARLFSEHGIPVLDLDQVGKKLIEQEPTILKELIQTFGKGILHQDKSLNRKALASIAFQDKQNTAKLNAIMHPRIKEEERLWREKQVKHPLAIIEASVLIESGDTQRMHGLIVVLCPTAIREQRVMKRGSHNLNQFKQILKRQCSDKQRLEQADYIFQNDTSLKVLGTQVIKFLNNSTIS